MVPWTGASKRYLKYKYSLRGTGYLIEKAQGRECRGMKQWAERFYRSKTWRQCRDAYFVFKHGLCERCQRRPGKIVHHKIYLTPQNINDPIVSLNFDNLELLCQDCHNQEHHGSDAVADGLMFDENGDLITTLR